jgi:hypothetical protein
MSPWARLDDNFHAHPRTLMSGLEANGLFARALSYCAHYLTDGFLPTEWAEGQGGKKPLQRLVDAGLVEEIEGGYLVIGYLERNPSREQVKAERDRERGKKAGQRSKSPASSPGESPGDNGRDTHGEVVPMSPRKDAA